MSGSNEPLITIVLTTFNSERVIEKTLKDIIEQDFPLNGIELIIVNGGSKDNTLKIIKEFIKHYAKKFYDVNVIVHDKIFRERFTTKIYIKAVK